MKAGHINVGNGFKWTPDDDDCVCVGREDEPDETRIRIIWRYKDSQSNYTTSVSREDTLY
jgi:hypothetical protein